MQLLRVIDSIFKTLEDENSSTDWTLLHVIFHILVKQLKLEKTRVEFKGKGIDFLDQKLEADKFAVQEIEVEDGDDNGGADDDDDEVRKKIVVLLQDTIVDTEQRINPFKVQIDFVTLTNRMDCAEMGVEKLTTLFADLKSDSAALSAELLKRLAMFEKILNSTTKSVTGSVPCCTALEALLNELNSRFQSFQDAVNTKLALSDKLLYADENKMSHTQLLKLHAQQISQIMHFMCCVEKELGEIQNNLKVLNTAREDHEERIEDLEERITKIETDIETINKDIKDLYAKQKLTEYQISVIVEELEQLKCFKTSREEFHDAIELKADKTVVARKLSYTTFTIVKQELTGLILKSYTTVEEQEEKWRSAILNLQHLADHTETDLKIVSLGKKLKTIDEKIDRLKRKQDSLQVQKNQRYCGGSHTKLSAEEKLFRIITPESKE